MRHLLLTLLLVFTLSGCNDNSQEAEQNAKIAQQTKAENEALLKKLKTQEEALKKAQLETQAVKEALQKKQAEEEKRQAESKQNEKLSKVGINIKEDKIIIDTNKTKDFFQTIGKNIGYKLKKISDDLNQGVIQEKNAGVQIDKTHVNIDINKTKNFLEEWGKKMQGYVKEFDDMAKEMDRETNTSL